MSKQRVLLVTEDKKLAMRVVLGSIAADSHWTFDMVSDLLEGLNRVSLLADTSDRVDLLIVDAQCAGGGDAAVRERLEASAKRTPVIVVGAPPTGEPRANIRVLGRQFSDRQFIESVVALMGRPVKTREKMPIEMTTKVAE